MAIRSALPGIWRGERNLWHPIREMNRLQRGIDRIFDETLTEPFSSLLRPALGLTEIEEEFTPPCDISESESHFLVSFDVPGVKKDEVKIEVRDNQLIVSGERKKERKEEGVGKLSQERYYGSFMRSFTLPSNIEADKVEASFENGVLHIALPKKEMSHGKRIPIKEGKLLSHEKEVKSEKAA